MSPIEGLIHDFQAHRGDHGLNGVDPRVKLALLAGVVAANVVVARLWLSLSLFCAGAALAWWSRIPARLFLLFFVAPAWATLLVFAGFSVGFGQTPVWSPGWVTVYREGMWQGASAALRVASDMAWMAAVFATTPFDKVLAALAWFRVPRVLLEAIAMGYRYAFLCIDEFSRMKESARLRGGFRTYAEAQKSTARILAQVVLRAYDRAQRIQQSMAGRGGADGRPGAPDPSGPQKECPNRCQVTPDAGSLAGPVLRCADVACGYPGAPVLRGVSFVVGKGEMVALCGPNGSGKTTLLKALSGILPAAAGEIHLCGRPLDKTTRNLAHRYVGYLSQDPNDQLFCTHVAEDVGYGPRNMGRSAEETERLVRTAMELMEVGHLAARPIHKLSHGEMKRVGLAGLIAMCPPLLLLDEPTANLDPASARELGGLLDHLKQEHGYTFIIVTHDMNFAAAVADRIIVLNDRRIAADGPARTILTDEALLSGARLEPPFLTDLFKEIFPDMAQRHRIPVTLKEARRIVKTLHRRTPPEG